MNKPIEIMQSKSIMGKNGFNLPYRIFIPQGNSKKKSPLLVFLHGAGERGCNNESQVTFHTELLERVIEKNNCIVVAPQCPEEMQWVNTPWKDGSYSFENTIISKPMESLIELLDFIEQQYDIDKTRVYIAGMSMGGYGSWNMLMRFPNKFAGAVIVCGAADPSQATAIKHIPVRTYHNADDPTVPVCGTREMVDALEKCGADIQYFEEPTGGHNSWHRAYTQEDLLDWLFNQKIK